MIRRGIIQNETGNKNIPRSSAGYFYAEMREVFQTAGTFFLLLRKIRTAGKIFLPFLHIMRFSS